MMTNAPLAKFVNICHWWYGRTTEDKLDKYWKKTLNMYKNVPYELDKMEVVQTIDITYKLEGYTVRKVYTMIFDTLFLHSRNQFAKWKIEQKIKKNKEQMKKNEAEMKQIEAQYQATCPECENRLCIDTPIMCWNNGLDENHEDYDEETVCSECYWECEWYKTDGNEDNQEEIEERVLFKEWLEETS